MNITDQLRKRLNDYQFEPVNGIRRHKSLVDVHRELDKEFNVSYEAFRQFWSAESESSGRFLNALDNFLKARGF